MTVDDHGNPDCVDPIDPLDHLVVVSAMSRLAGQGGWERILQGKPLEDEIDLVDAELLVHAGVLRRLEDDTLEPVHAHPWHYDAPALAAGTIAQLRRALHHAEGRTTGWSGQDEDTLTAQGLASAAAAAVVCESLLPAMPGSYAAFRSGSATLLDVGVGIGSFASTVCQTWPGSTAVGLDVLPMVLDLAAARTREVGLDQRIELRLQSMADLDDVDRFDLAWVPQGFIPHAAFVPGLRAVHRALRPDRWLVLFLAAAPRDASDFERAVQDHSAALTGGGPVVVDDVLDHLRAVGFDQVRELRSGEQTLVLARRPD